MAGFSFFETFDDSEVVKGLGAIEDFLVSIKDAASKAGIEMNEAMASAAISATSLEKVIEKLIVSQKAASLAAQNSQSQHKKLGQILKETIGSFQLGGRSLGEWTAKFGEFGNAVLAGGRALLGMATGARVLAVAIAATGIGALLIGIGSLLTGFAQLKKDIPLLKITFAGLSSGIKAVITDFDNLGKIAKSTGKIMTAGLNVLVRGKEGIYDVAGAVAVLSGEWSEMQKNFSDANALGQYVARLSASMDAFERENELEANRRENRAKMFRFLADDESKSIESRIKLLKEAASIDEENSQVRIKLARMEREMAANSGATEQEFNAARIKYEDLVAAAQLNRLESQRKINDLLNGEKERVKKLTDEWQKLFDSFAQKAAELENSDDDPLQKIFNNWKKATDEATLVAERLRELAPNEEARKQTETVIKQMFEGLTKQFSGALITLSAQEQQVAKLLSLDSVFENASKNLERKRDLALATFGVDDESRKAINESFDVLFDDLKTLFEDRQKEIKDRKLNFLPIDDIFEKDAAASLANAMNRVIRRTAEGVEKEAFDLFQHVLDGINKALRTSIDKDTAKELLAGLKTAVADTFDGLAALSDARISAIDREIAKIDDLISKQTEAVEAQKQRDSEGLSNTLDSEQKKLDALEKQRQAAARKRLAEERKIANIQLAIDSAQQASGLATGAANIMKSASNKGLLGILFAVGAIATMFSIFAKAKANAEKFREVPKFRRGGRIKGRSHEDGGEIYVGPSGANELEGGEWVVSRQPANEHDGFIEQMNRGRYRGVNLHRMAEEQRGKYGGSKLAMAPGESADIMRANQEALHDHNSRRISAAVRESGQQVVQAIEGRPVIMPWKSGYKVKTKRGAVTETKNVQPE